MKRLLEIAKYITAIGVIGGAALYFDGFRDDIGDNHDVLMDTMSEMRNEIHVVKSDFDQYKKTTNTHRVYKATQTNILLKDIRVLKRNQQAIINNSTEQKEILDEINTRRIINGNGVGMEPIKPIDPEMLVYNK